jgi:dihydroxyacetone kinase
MIQNPLPMIILAVGLVAAAAAANAQTTETGQAQTIRLSPEQIAKVRDSDTETAATATTAADLSGRAIGKGIHGEVGMAIGTNGARGVFGTAAIPLGENAGAVISFEDSRFGRR